MIHTKNKHCLICLLIWLFVFTPFVYAKNKLSEIDILDPGEKEIKIDYSFSSRKSEYTVSSQDKFKGDFKETNNEAKLFFGYGIKRNLEFNLTLPYVFVGKTTYANHFDNFDQKNSFKSTGFRDLQFKLAYKLPDEKSENFAYILKLGIKPDTASNAYPKFETEINGQIKEKGKDGSLGTGTSDFIFGASFGNKGEIYQIYLDIAYTLKGGKSNIEAVQEGGNFLDVLMGAIWSLNSKLSMDNSLKISLINNGSSGKNGTTKFDNNNIYKILLQIFYEVIPNITVIPKIEYEIIGKAISTDISSDIYSTYKNQNSIILTMGIYYLF